MVVFLMENEKRVECYLKDLEISEVIYNFHKGDDDSDTIERLEK